MANKEIRCALIAYDVKQYRVAEKIGISETGFSRKLRKELPQEEKAKILAVIEQLAKG